MKKNYILFTKAVIVMILLSQFKLFAQSNPEDPRFKMIVKNIHTLNPFSSVRDSIARFEIWIQQINQGEPGVNDFEYCCGQFTWSYNRAIQGNGNLTFGLYSPGCELPPALRPPSFQVDSVNGYLKMSGNLPQSLANFFISGTFPGTKILTAQLRTSAPFFVFTFLNLRFKLGPSPNTFIAHFRPYPDSVDSEQFPNQYAVALMDTVNPGNQPVYFVEPSMVFYPVEMESFTSNVNKNNVTLNWTTSTETNNAGFEIQRLNNKSNEETWEKAGYISGNGTTTESKTYSFTERTGTGRYKYRLKQIDYNGSFDYHELHGEVVVGIPIAFSLSQNYPNPFNPSTKIDFELPHDGNVSILLYDVSGREVARLIKEFKTAGYYTLQFDGSNISSGMYFYRINAEGGGQSFVQTKKLALIK